MRLFYLCLSRDDGGDNNNDDQSVMTFTSPCSFLLLSLHATGTIVFYANALPNAEIWLYYEDYFAYPITRLDRGMISTHTCSYICWLASAVGDPEDRCYFPNRGITSKDPLVGRQHTSKEGQQSFVLLSQHEDYCLSPFLMTADDDVWMTIPPHTHIHTGNL